jgi:iron complex transport system substrate-binding protein
MIGPRTSIAALLSTAVLASGCAGPTAGHSDHATQVIERTPLTEVQPRAKAASITGPTTAVLADRRITPVTDDPDQKLPVTMRSKQGDDKDVRITDTSRVVAFDIAGSITATVWGLGFGDSLVGRDVAASFPGTEKLPVVTRDGHSINVEAVLKLEPTLVITDGSIGPRDVVDQLRDAGVTLVYVDNDSTYAGAAKLARDVAAIYGAPDAGTKLAQRITADADSTRATITKLRGDDAALRMVFVYLRGSAGVYYILGQESGASDLISALGGFDVAAEQGWNDSIPMTDESLVSADPDLVLVMTDGIKSVGGLDKLVADRPALALTTAGKNRRFVDMADSDILSFGPRAAGVLDALARAVYAPESL